jgi:hypothetical protein
MPKMTVMASFDGISQKLPNPLLRRAIALDFYKRTKQHFNAIF